MNMDKSKIILYMFFRGFACVIKASDSGRDEMKTILLSVGTTENKCKSSLHYLLRILPPCRVLQCQFVPDRCVREQKFLDDASLGHMSPYNPSFTGGHG